MGNTGKNIKGLHALKADQADEKGSKHTGGEGRLSEGPLILAYL